MDSEFYERGPHQPILLISLGIVTEDGRELYIENADVDLNHVSPWLKQNVVPHLLRTKSFEHPEGKILPHDQIGQAVLKFVGNDTKPHFWGYFADYDWVLFSQLYGAMVDLPETFPMFCRDLKQEMWRLGVEKPVIEGCGPGHNAVADARWNRALYNWMVEKKGLVLP